MTKRTTPGSEDPSASSEVWTEAERAADAFRVALGEAIDQLPKRPDLEGPAQALGVAFDAVRPGSAERALAAASAALSRGITLRSDDPVLKRGSARLGLAAVLEALDDVLVRFDRQADLDRAQQVLERLAQERRDVLVELEAAIAAADVEAVLRLRPRIEVELPAAMDAGRLTVVELRLARAQAAQQRPRLRSRQAAQAEEQARRELDYARQRLQEAVTALNGAAVEKMQADHLVAQAKTRVDGLRSERDKIAKDNHASLQDRLRRLAGLPPNTAAAT